MARQPDPRALLSALADALNACEDAGLKIRVRHGPVILTRAGYVPRFGRTWRTAFPMVTDDPGPGDDDDDLDD